MPAPPLVCYDVDSDTDTSDLESDMEEEVKPKIELEEVKPEIELIEYSPDEVVRQLLEEVMDNVFHGARDFSDMFIKEEPIDIDDIKEEVYDVSYRDDVKIEIKSDDESSDEELVSGGDDDDEISIVKSRDPPRTKNELRLCDLPPVEDDLDDVNVGEDEVTMIGRITSIVDELVVIESVPGHPAIDLESVLFLESGRRALGRVFDVIGPVALPWYCVRFNSRDHIEEKSITPGMEVFYAPKSDEFTSYVFLEQLMNLKISDASWRDDEEPPPQFLDYSDDEEERRAKKEVIITKMVRAGASEEEIARKRARLHAPRQQRRDRSSSYDSGVGEGSGYGRNQQQQHFYNNQQQYNNGGEGDGNMRYNNQRHDNGVYSRQMNPFYRQSRVFNPRNQGPIRWSSVGPAAVGGNHGPMGGGQGPPGGYGPMGGGQGPPGGGFRPMGGGQGPPGVGYGPMGGGQGPPPLMNFNRPQPSPVNLQANNFNNGNTWQQGGNNSGGGNLWQHNQPPPRLPSFSTPPPHRFAQPPPPPPPPQPHHNNFPPTGHQPPQQFGGGNRPPFGGLQNIHRPY